MNSINKFQIALIATFIIFALVGVILFSAKTASNNGPTREVTVWGSMESSLFETSVSRAGLRDQYVVDYRFVDVRSLERELTEALAEDRGPDLVVYPHQYMLELRKRTTLIPFSSFPERSFRDTFAQGATLFLTQNGAIGLPIAIDPLVMYWNTTLYTNGGFVKPPVFWDEAPSYIEGINKINGVDIRTTAFALGTYQNISHVKDVLSTFFLQAGIPIVQSSGGGYMSTLRTPQAESAVRFFTEFSNPSKTVYSWNSAMPVARQAFISGVLATYFGYASEAPVIQKANPNLSFDISIMPQVRDSDRVVYGTFWTVSVVDKTSNIDSAFAFLGALTSLSSSRAFAETGSMSPARRDLLADTSSTDIYQKVFNESAILSKGWVDPKPGETGEIFRQIVQSVNAGGVRISEALQEADRLLSILIDKIR